MRISESIKNDRAKVSKGKHTFCD